MFLLLLSFIFFFQCSAHHRALHSFPTRRSSDLGHRMNNSLSDAGFIGTEFILDVDLIDRVEVIRGPGSSRSEEHTSELQSRQYLVCRLLLEKKKTEVRFTEDSIAAMAGTRTSSV